MTTNDRKGGRRERGGGGGCKASSLVTSVARERETSYRYIPRVSLSSLSLYRASSSCGWRWFCGNWQPSERHDHTRRTVASSLGTSHASPHPISLSLYLYTCENLLRDFLFFFRLACLCSNV